LGNPAHDYYQARATSFDPPLRLDNADHRQFQRQLDKTEARRPALFAAIRDDPAADKMRDGGRDAD
jgi:hypothetical protein